MLTHFRKFILITLFSLYNIPLSAQLLPSSYNTFEGKPEVVIELKKLIDQSDLDVSIDPRWRHP